MTQAPAIPAQDARARMHPALACLLLLVLAFAAHGSILSNDFITVDDPSYVYLNPQVTQGLTPQTILWAFTSFNVGNWHPVTMLSHLLDVTLFGLNPACHHATTLLFQCANVCLLFILLARLTGSAARAWCVAALFAVHPAHVEAIAWLSCRKDVLCVFFLTISLLFHLQFLDHRRPAARLLSYAAFALALMSKPTAVTFPILLLLLDFWPLNRLQQTPSSPAFIPKPPTTLPSLLLEKAPFFALAFLSGIITLIAQKDSGAVITTHSLAPAERLFNAINSYCQYLLIAIYPVDLAFLYPWRPQPPAVIAGQALFLLALTAAAIYAGYRKNLRYLTTGWLWFIIALLPMIGILQVGVQSMADRYTYIPFIGLYIAVVWAAADLIQLRAALRPIVLLAFAALLLSFTALAHAQSQRWVDPITLFDHGLSVTGPNPALQGYSAQAHLLAGNYDLALQHFEISARLQPENQTTFESIGYVLYLSNRPRESAQAYIQAADKGPIHPDSWQRMGWAFLTSGQPHQALTVFQKGIQVNGRTAQMLTGLAAATAASGDTPSALTLFDECQTAFPDYIPSRFHKAQVLVEANRPQEAIPLLAALLKADPNHAPARVLYAQALALTGQAPQARAILQALLNENPNNPAALQALQNLDSPPATQPR
jgi:protein O-mannosyl-transferase